MANQLALARRHRSGVPTKMDRRTQARISRYLKQNWSPEQIAGRLKKKAGFRISHQTICTFIHKDRSKGGALYKHLRRKKRYRRRGSRQGTIIQDRVSIDERPSIVDARERIGDRELDTIVSACRQSALVTAVERVSKYTIIGKLDRNTAMSLAHFLSKAMGPMRRYVHTLTSDNGTEFAAHKYISNKLDANFYFAHPYRPCERGLNEHTNGLIREYFRKELGSTH